VDTERIGTLPSYIDVGLRPDRIIFSVTGPPIVSGEARLCSCASEQGRIQSPRGGAGLQACGKADTEIGFSR
jgi:hypothetical protein